MSETPDRSDAGPSIEPASEMRQQSEGLRLLLEELERPLESVQWTHTPLRDSGGDYSMGSIERARSKREHRRELKLAREAASRAFNVQPRLSTRKLATTLLTPN